MEIPGTPPTPDSQNDNAPAGSGTANGGMDCLGMAADLDRHISLNLVDVLRVIR